MGRKPITGPFSTRAEFCDAVWAEYRLEGSTINSIARWLKVSPGVVNKVIDRQEGKPEGWKVDGRC